MMEEIPVYLFTGFLDAGKTKFIQETLEDVRFNGESTLLLLCEEGEEEYEPTTFSGKNVFIEVIEDPSELTPINLERLQKKHAVERVIVEYNGMWDPDTILSVDLPGIHVCRRPDLLDLQRQYAWSGGRQAEKLRNGCSEPRGPAGGQGGDS